MSLERLLTELQTSGYCVIENVIPDDRCHQIRESVAATARREGPNSPHAPKHIDFVPGLINYDQSFAPYLADSRIMYLAEKLLGGHTRISFTSAIVNVPGNDRGDWHADWPYNQKNAGHFPVPYADAVAHLTTLWMLSPFSKINGGTLVVPGSHRVSTNPTAGNGFDSKQQYATEIHVEGPAGCVLMFDARLWHATSPNRSNEPRVALAVRYAPWWLNLEVLRPESDERKRLVDETGATDNRVPSVPRGVFDRLPEAVKPLYRHWIEN